MYSVTDMDLRKALAEILEIDSFKRIDEVTKLLSNGGVVTADDLKYFDLNSLKELGNLSTMEVNKIMGYVQKKFPEEYDKHKKKSAAEHEKKLLQKNMRFEKMNKILKEQQEMEEQLKRSQEQSDASKGKASSWTEKPMPYWNDFKKYATGYEKEDADKDMTIEQAVFKIFADKSPMIEPVTSFLKKQKIAKAKDMINLDWETLKCCEEWAIFEMEKIKEFVEKNFHENNAKHKRKCKGPKGPSKYENIEELISEIFALYSNEARINQIKQILHEDGVTTADELKSFDWKLLEDLGLTSSEAARIMDFVKENFPKHFKIHERRRDEANRMQEELSKCKDDIIKLTKLAKQSREKKAEDVETQEKQSSSQAEATELRRQKDEPICNKSEDQTQTTNNIHLLEDLCLSDLIDTQIELPIEEAVAKILEGCNRSRLIFVTRMLMEEGAHNSKELKCFNRNSLEELGVLKKEEIDKILKFIQES